MGEPFPACSASRPAERAPSTHRPTSKLSMSCPRKCLQVAPTATRRGRAPPCSPRTNATARCDCSSGSSPHVSLSRPQRGSLQAGCKRLQKAAMTGFGDAQKPQDDGQS